VKGNVHRTWAAFLRGCPLLPYLLPIKTAQHHTVLSWYTYSGVPLSCISCSVFTTDLYTHAHTDRCASQ
jgi:hypothetical protein